MQATNLRTQHSVRIFFYLSHHHSFLNSLASHLVSSPVSLYLMGAASPSSSKNLPFSSKKPITRDHLTTAQQSVKPDSFCFTLASFVILNLLRCPQLYWNSDSFCFKSLELTFIVRCRIENQLTERIPLITFHSSVEQNNYGTTKG